MNGSKRFEYHSLPIPKTSTCWECPKCGAVEWKDLKVVTVDGLPKLQHSCGSFCKVKKYDSEFRQKVS